MAAIDAYLRSIREWDYNECPLLMRRRVLRQSAERIRLNRWVYVHRVVIPPVVKQLKLPNPF